MNYKASFRSINEEVSREEWQTRVDLAACYRLVDRYGMADLIYNHITARVPGPTHHLLINLYGLPAQEILEKTAHLYQPGTRRPYGVLEWPAMLRLLAAEAKGSTYPPYWQ